MHTDERMENLYSHIIDPVPAGFRVNENLRVYHSDFFMNGTVAVINRWLKNECRESPEEISRIIEELCKGGRSIG